MMNDNDDDSRSRMNFDRVISFGDNMPHFWRYSLQKCLHELKWPLTFKGHSGSSAISNTDRSYTSNYFSLVRAHTV